MGGVLLEEFVGPHELQWPFLENAVCCIRQGGLGWGGIGDVGGDYWCFMQGAGSRGWRKWEHALQLPGRGDPG